VHKINNPGPESLHHYEYINQTPMQYTCLPIKPIIKCPRVPIQYDTQQNAQGVFSTVSVSTHCRKCQLIWSSYLMTFEVCSNKLAKLHTQLQRYPFHWAKFLPTMISQWRHYFELCK